MTNGDRVRNYTDKEIEECMRRFADCEFKKYVDLLAWLASEEEKYPIAGEAAMVKLDDGREYPGTIVERREVYGEDYFRLIMGDDFPYTSRILSVPVKNVVPI